MVRIKNRWPIDSEYGYLKNGMLDRRARWHCLIDEDETIPDIKKFSEEGKGTHKQEKWKLMLETNRRQMRSLKRAMRDHISANPVFVEGPQLPPAAPSALKYRPPDARDNPREPEDVHMSDAPGDARDALLRTAGEAGEVSRLLVGQRAEMVGRLAAARRVHLARIERTGIDLSVEMNAVPPVPAQAFVPYKIKTSKGLVVSEKDDANAKPPGKEPQPTPSNNPHLAATRRPQATDPPTRNPSLDAIAAAKRKLQQQLGSLSAPPPPPPPQPAPAPPRPPLAQKRPAPPPHKLDLPPAGPHAGPGSARTPVSAAPGGTGAGPGGGGGGTQRDPRAGYKPHGTSSSASASASRRDSASVVPPSPTIAVPTTSTQAPTPTTPTPTPTNPVNILALLANPAGLTPEGLDVLQQQLDALKAAVHQQQQQQQHQHQQQQQQQQQKQGDPRLRRE